MHDISNSLTPTNISNLFTSQSNIRHIIQDRLQEVTITLNTQG